MKLPRSVEPWAVRLFIACRPILKLLFLGRQRYCPVCDSWTRRFLPHGPPALRQDDARCPVCRAVIRHRLTWLYLKERTTLLDGAPKRLLHVAPEISMMSAFKRVPGLRYLSADLDSPHAMVRMDLTAIDAPEGSFDAIYCSHVLEHVSDDRKAMREMYRVLKPGGCALIMVPLSERPTHEDPGVTDPAERERLFLQSDHLRLYGPDIRERLAAAGFEVRLGRARDILDEAGRRRMGLTTEEVIFDARKPRSGAAHAVE